MGIETSPCVGESCKEADIECIVACDVHPTALARIENDRILLHDDPLTLVEQFNLDSVIVATPNETHYDLGTMFLNKGVDVFLEKPIATTFDDASSLVSTSVHEGKTLKSGSFYDFIRASSMQEPKSVRKIGAIQSIRYSKNVQRQGDESSHALDTLAIHGSIWQSFFSMDKPPCEFPKLSVPVHPVY